MENLKEFQKVKKEQNLENEDQRNLPKIKICQKILSKNSSRNLSKNLSKNFVKKKIVKKIVNYKQKEKKIYEC